MASSSYVFDSLSNSSSGPPPGFEASAVTGGGYMEVLTNFSIVYVRFYEALGSFSRLLFSELSRLRLGLLPIERLSSID